MRELSNLSWPHTPYGADKRPFAKKVHLLTGMAVSCADNGHDTVPVGAAAVFVPVTRTSQTTVMAATLHFGYKAAVADQGRDTQGMLRFTDRILVQGRRHAAVVAWHSYADDLHVMNTLAAERLPGVTAIGDGWKDRSRRERGTAPLVDTAEDLDGTQGLIASAAERHSIILGGPLRSFQRPDTTQGLFDALSGPADAAEAAVKKLVAAALAQALTVALLAGKATGRLRWDEPFDAEEALRREAWHQLSPVLDTRRAPSR